MPSYTEVSVSSYDSSPPVDNGAETDANRIKWSTIKTKLSDPLNTAIGSIDDNIAAAITTLTSNMSTSTTNLATVTSTYATVSARIYAPSGTAALFVQTAAPTGWTKGSTHNNKALRVVSGAASTGGSTAFTTVFASTTITSSNMPTHTHDWTDTAQAITFNLTLYTGASLSGSEDDWDGSGSQERVTSITVDTETLSATSSVSGTTGTKGSGTAMDFAVRYVDVIVATKD